MEAVATIDPPPRPAQGRESGVHAEDDAVEVDAHRLAVGEQVEVLVDPAAGADAGVEEGQVQPAEQLLRLRGGRQHLLEVADVGTQEVPAELLGDGPAALLVDVDEDDAVTAPDELAGDLRAEAGRATRDEGALAHAVAPAATPVPWVPPSPTAAPPCAAWPGCAPSTRTEAIRSRCWAASP